MYVRLLYREPLPMAFALIIGCRSGGPIILMVEIVFYDDESKKKKEKNDNDPEKKNWSLFW